MRVAAQLGAVLQLGANAGNEGPFIGCLAGQQMLYPLVVKQPYAAETGIAVK